jgi:ABC-2 type transport system permease protein
VKAFFVVAWNEIRVEFSERSTIIFFLILPILFTGIVGIGLSSLDSDSDQDGDNRLSVAIVDKDKSDLSEFLISNLNQSSTAKPVLLSEQEALAAQQAGEVYAVLTIPSGYSEHMEEEAPIDLPLEVDPDSLVSSIIEEAVLGASVHTTGALLAGSSSLEKAAALMAFESEEEEQRYLADFYTRFEDMYDPPPLGVVIESAGVEEPEVIATGFAQSSPGQLVTWTMITFLGTTVVLVYERQMGTLRRLITMPVPPAVLLGGKLFGRLLLGLIEMLILILSGVYIFGVSWGGSPAALAIHAVCYGLSATSLGLFLATVIKTTRQADSVRTIASMVLAALGGAWWPMEITGETFQTIAQILPTTWAMRGFNDIILRGQGVSGIALESSVLLGFAAFFFLLSWRRFKFE